MKIGGVEIKGPNEEIVVIPRPYGDLVFRAETVRNFDEFDALVPEPKAPGIRTKDGYKPDIKDENYQQLLTHYQNQRMAYLVVKSLESSEIEWDTVNLSDPSSWLKWDKELQAAGLSEIETQRITVTVMQANCLDEQKMVAARAAFLLGQAKEASESSGRVTEQRSS
jgi:hypothetical protein